MQGSAEIISPFEWWRAKAPEQAPRRARSKPAPKPRLTAAEKTARILAHRWGNPYCRPGWP